MKTTTFEGVVLTPKAIEQLKALQYEDCSLMKWNIRELSAIAKFVATEEYMNEDFGSERALRIISTLFNIADQFEQLFAVEEEND